MSVETPSKTRLPRRRVAARSKRPRYPLFTRTRPAVPLQGQPPHVTFIGAVK